MGPCDHKRSQKTSSGTRGWAGCKWLGQHGHWNGDFEGGKWIHITLWLFNIAMENSPFIDGLPIKNGGSFHGYVNVYQRVYIIYIYIYIRLIPAMDRQMDESFLRHSAKFGLGPEGNSPRFSARIKLQASRRRHGWWLQMIQIIISIMVIHGQWSHFWRIVCTSW